MYYSSGVHIFQAALEIDHDLGVRKGAGISSSQVFDRESIAQIASLVVVMLGAGGGQCRVTR